MGQNIRQPGGHGYDPGDLLDDVVFLIQSGFEIFSGSVLIKLFKVIAVKTTCNIIK